MKALAPVSCGTRTQTRDAPLVFHSSTSNKRGVKPSAPAKRRSPPAAEANCTYEKPGRFVLRVMRAGKFCRTSLRWYPAKVIFIREPNEPGESNCVVNWLAVGAQTSPLELVAQKRK